MSVFVSEEEFAERLQKKLGEFWPRALKIFHACGKSLSLNVLAILVYAMDFKKVPEVINRLENVYREWEFCSHCQQENCPHRTPEPVNKEVFLAICEMLEPGILNAS